MSNQRMKTPGYTWATKTTEKMIKSLHKEIATTAYPAVAGNRLAEISGCLNLWTALTINDLGSDRRKADAERLRAISYPLADLATGTSNRSES